MTRYRTRYADQRQWLDKVLNEGFIWLGLRSVDLSRPCSCKADNAPKAPCSRCLNTGYAFTDYLMKGHIWRNTPGVDFQTPLGPISTDTYSMVSRYDRPIKQRDLVLELDAPVTVDQPRQPFKIMKIFLISSSRAIRGMDGRIEFYQSFLEERNLQDYRS